MRTTTDIKSISQLDDRLIRSAIQDGLSVLDPAILEKDLLVTDVLRLLFTKEFDNCRLVFCGGTCLSKAHKTIDRMSEDIDFKVVVPNELSKNAKSKALSNLKHDIIFLLEENGYVIPQDRIIARNSNSYIGIDVLYQSAYSSNISLRSEIKIEITANPPLLQTAYRDVDSMISQLTGINTNPFSVMSIGVEETLAEKVVSFLRRTAEFQAGRNRGDYDDRLVRHLYDCYMIIQKNQDIIDNLPVSHFVNTIVLDAIQFKNQYPEFLIDPIGEMQKVLTNLSSNTMHQKYYADFVDALVYGKKVSFNDAVNNFSYIANSMINSDILIKLIPYQ